MPKNTNFCILPFIHLHVNENTDIKLCCVTDTTPIGKYTPDFEFNTDSRMQDVRKRMLDGERIEHCANCYNFEDGGAVSQRQQTNKEWFSKLNISEIAEVQTELVYYDIRNDNLCNLGCRMCGPQSSSQLEKEFDKIGWGHSATPKTFGFDDVIDLGTVKKIYVSGGEPSLLPKFRTFLKRAIHEGKTDFAIQLNTNATNTNAEFCELLSHFSDVNVAISIDGFDSVNKYIRWPANWDSMIQNIHRLYAITNNIAFSVTVSIWNISNLSPLVEFLESEFHTNTILLNKVNYPGYMEFTSFPNITLAIADLMKMTSSYNYINELQFRTKIDYYIRELTDCRLNETALREFFTYNDALDVSRNINLIDYIPELEKCREYLTKQI